MDLDSGRRPELESDEFSVTTPLVVEILGREFDTFPKKVYTYWDFESGVRGPHNCDWLEPLSAVRGGGWVLKLRLTLLLSLNGTYFENKLDTSSELAESFPTVP